MDPGAIFRDLREADLTRAIAPKIIPHLEKAGVEVQGVPLDLPLLQRIQWINNTGYTDAAGDICVEIHINDGGNRGIEAWYRGHGGNNSHKLAKTVVNDVTATTGYKSQGIKSEHEHELGSLTFLNRTNTASILLETLYMDNEEDIAILTDQAKLEELAKSIAKGILKYMGKDLDGKDLPADQLPDYSDIKVVSNEQPATTSTLPTIQNMGNLPTPRASTPIPTTNSASTAPNPQPGNAFSSKPNTNFMADREQRREMIEKTYVKILGRKPNQSDLNYFLNVGIAELDLVKKMVDSQEHLDLVKAKQELAELKENQSKQALHIQKLEAAINDQKTMLINLNHLLQHKNNAITQLEQASLLRGGVASQSMQSSAPVPTVTISDGSSPSHSQLKTSFSRKIFSYISKLLD